MEKCVILYNAKYCLKIEAFFCVPELHSRGIDVEYWDVGDITMRVNTAEIEDNTPKIITIKTISELENRINKNRNAFYFLFISYAWFSVSLYKILSRYSCKTIYCTSGALPASKSPRKSFLPRSLNNIVAILKIKLANLYLRNSVFKPCDFVLQSCKYAWFDYKEGKSTRFISCNSGDYQLARNCIKQFSIKYKRYVVFIDQYLPFHKDFKLFGMDNIDSKRYYDRINKLFDIIERTYDCNVVICAHPSSVKYRTEDYFYGRPVFYNETRNIVKDCVFAITHNSTAISYAVIFRKPVLIYTSDELNEKNTTRYSVFSNLLNLPVVNIDNVQLFNKDLLVDQLKYDEYLYDYLTTPKSKNRNNSDIIESILSNKYQEYLYIDN